jgi:hypothetical protein
MTWLNRVAVVGTALSKRQLEHGTRRYQDAFKERMYCLLTAQNSVFADSSRQTQDSSTIQQPACAVQQQHAAFYRRQQAKHFGRHQA